MPTGGALSFLFGKSAVLWRLKSKPTPWSGGYDSGAHVGSCVTGVPTWQLEKWHLYLLAQSLGRKESGGERVMASLFPWGLLSSSPSASDRFRENRSETSPPGRPHLSPFSIILSVLGMHAHGPGVVFQLRSRM